MNTETQGELKDKIAEIDKQIADLDRQLTVLENTENSDSKLYPQLAELWWKKKKERRLAIIHQLGEKHE